MVVRMMRVLVISPSRPPSPSCPPPLQAPPAALGPAVLPAAGRVPLRSPFAILLLLLLLLLAAPPAHHLWEHFLVFLAVASLPPCSSPSHPPPSVAHTTTKRGWLQFFSWLRSQMTPLTLSLPFHYSVVFFLDLWLWPTHSLLFLPLQQQLACSAVCLSRPPLSLYSLFFTYSKSQISSLQLWLV